MVQKKKIPFLYEHNALPIFVLALGGRGDGDGWQRRPWLIRQTSLLAQRNNNQHIGKFKVSMNFWKHIEKIGIGYNI
jgi:hypothetical protein